MKTLNFYRPITFFIAVIILVSCVKDDEYDVPITDPIAPNIDGTIITIDSLLGLLLQEVTNNENDILSFTDSDLYVSGYVISNDEAGNFFEELILQDTPENPIRGVKILIDVNPLFTTYEFGRKIFIKLDGLSVGYDSGVLTLGLKNGNKLEKIAESLMAVTIIRDIEIVEIVPLHMNISDFSELNTNLYIQLNEVQFNRCEVLVGNPKTYAAEPEDQFDGERILENCTEGTSTIFSTSTFADFKAILLPAGRGSLDGILTKNFFGEEFNVVVNTPETINFENDDFRCDLDCGIVTLMGSTILFSDFFETQNEGSPISGNGWTNYTEEGTELWEAYSDEEPNASLGISARVGSFFSGDENTIAWLITPEINFDTQEGETLNFKTSNSFANGSTLEVLFSSNWDGNENTISSSIWRSFPSANIVKDDDFFGDWIDSNIIDFSCFTGSGHFAFKYVGSGHEDYDGTYELDEILINSN